MSVEYGMEEVDLAKKIMLRLGYGSTVSREPGACSLTDGIAKMIAEAGGLVRAPVPAQGVALTDARVDMDRYDAGLLSDFGSGNVDWWQDYIRAELERADEFYQAQHADMLAQTQQATIKQNLMVQAARTSTADSNSPEFGGINRDGASDALDAARYRWLRDKSEPGICAFYLSVGKAFDGVKFTQETVDQAIDDQIAAAGSGALATTPTPPGAV